MAPCDASACRHINGGAEVAATIEVLRSSHPEPSTAPARFPRLGAVWQDRWLSTELRTDGSVLLAFFRQERMGSTQHQALMDGILRASATGSRFDGWLRPSVGTAIGEAAYAVMMAVIGVGLMVFGDRGVALPAIRRHRHRQWAAI